jgi:hypothetical protein
MFINTNKMTTRKKRKDILQEKIMKDYHKLVLKGKKKLAAKKLVAEKHNVSLTWVYMSIKEKICT